ncbi:MAG: cobalamin-dependent protein [Deltaproteobacteria bacterium]|nr:cobalamin-dependent protein [Deltaproteobacteria bacterium]
MNERLEAMARQTRGRGPRIALVSLYDVENNAVRLLAAILRRAGFWATEVYFKDWISNHLDPPTDVELDAFVDVLRREAVDLVALSVRASAYENVGHILTQTVHDRLRLPVLWGGVHPTLMPDACIADGDLVIRGEADEALLELATRLCDGLSFDDVQNLWIRRGPGDVVQNPLRPVLPDLDALPFRDYVTHDRKFFILGRSCKTGDPMRGDPNFQMLASRGCIYRCSYCYNSSFKRDIYKGQRWYRHRSLDSTLQELKEAKAHWDFKRVRFDDEVFIFEREWFAEFCRRYPVEVGVPFEIFIEPKLVDAERMQALRKAGLSGLYMGVQASERVNADLYDRNVKNSTIAEIARLFHRLGIYPHYQLIFDDPVASEADLRALFDLVASFPRPYDLFLFSLTVFPGSELNRKLIDEGFITCWDIEGENTRTFYQHRVNLAYPRPPEHTFWISLIQLLSKPFLPVAALRPLTRAEVLKRHPWPLVQVALATNYVKLGARAARMVVDGEMTATMLRRWLSLSRVITN